MKVTATQSYEIHLGFVLPNGVQLPAVGASPNYVEIDDIYADNEHLIALKDAGKLTISGFDKDSALVVGATELNEHLLGLFSFAFPKNTPGAISGGTSASIVSANDEAYDLRAKNYFRFLVDGTLSDPVFDLEVTVAAGIYTAATLVNALNGDATFTEHLVASVSGGTKVQVECRSKGGTSFVVAAVPVLGPLADANDNLGFPTAAPSVAGTGTASNITAQAVGPTNVGMHRAKLYVAAYTTDSGGGDVVSAGAFIQVPKKGTIISGIYQAGVEAVVETDQDGYIDIEIADVTHADNPVFLGFRALTGYDFAIIPTGGGTRVSVANA